MQFQVQRQSNYSFPNNRVLISVILLAFAHVAHQTFRHILFSLSKPKRKFYYFSEEYFVPLSVNRAEAKISISAQTRFVTFTRITDLGYTIHVSILLTSSKWLYSSWTVAYWNCMCVFQFYLLTFSKLFRNYNAKDLS